MNIIEAFQTSDVVKRREWVHYGNFANGGRASFTKEDILSNDWHAEPQDKVRAKTKRSELVRDFLINLDVSLKAGEITQEIAEEVKEAMSRIAGK